MQIVAGRFRRRKLETNPGDTTRPLLTRVKIALFDRIEPLLKNARVADIYSGTGTIGLEALSRGARRVTFFEADRRAFDLLRRNVASLRVEDETLTWKTDVTKCSFRPRKGEEFLPFDVIFFDPPYAHLHNLAPGTMLYRSLQRLAREGISAPRAWLLVRCEQGTQFSMPEAWEQDEVLEYSSMEVHLFRKSVTPPAPTPDDLADELDEPGEEHDRDVAVQMDRNDSELRESAAETPGD
jgi:16S rRNA (guanine966-N2)-methyltransferase